MRTGTYKAKVVGVSLEVLGEANYPVLKVTFSPNQYLNGSVFVEGEYKDVDKIYFLSAELATKGPFAGQSKIEILKNELRDTYGYTKDLAVENLTTMIGAHLEIVVEQSKKGYPQVSWVNKPSGKKRGTKAMPPDILAKLNSAFLGVTVGKSDASTDPTDFFAKLKSDA
jgi:Txe/YoeB family toxin of Txe-Axe toxin-antitoxin module